MYALNNENYNPKKLTFYMQGNATLNDDVK